MVNTLPAEMGPTPALIVFILYTYNCSYPVNDLAPPQHLHKKILRAAPADHIRQTLSALFTNSVYTMQGRFYTGAYRGQCPCKNVPGPPCVPLELTDFVLKSFTRFYSGSHNEMRKGHCSFFVPVNKVTETIKVLRAEEME